MKVRELFRAGGPRVFSFEFFPPKSADEDRLLWRAIRELEPLRPSFVSVTYGAGGSTRERTRDIVVHIERDTGITAMAHLTCVGAAEDEIGAVVDRLAEGGIENIMALREVVRFSVRRNTGARSLRSFIEEICHEVMFDAPEKRGETIVIDAATARKRLERFDGVSARGT